MNTNTHDHQETTRQTWTNYGATTPVDARQQSTPEGHKHRRSGHMWMMMLMCLPLLAVGIWSFLSGTNPSGLIAGLLCIGMMAVMHLGMGHGRNHHR